MKELIKTSHSAEETTQLGKDVGGILAKGDIVCLFGDLGSGKTTFVKGLASEQKVSPFKVNSPTFVLMNVYEGKIPIYHFDLYRIKGEEGLSSIGLQEFLYAEGISVIEWADKMEELLPEQYLSVEFQHEDENERVVRICANGKKYQSRINKLKLS